MTATPKGEKATAEPTAAKRATPAEAPTEAPTSTVDTADRIGADGAGGFTDIDRVAMVSVKTDGHPDQTPGYEAAVDLADEEDPRGGTSQ